MLSKSNGFTLIELMITIFLLGLIFTLMVVNLSFLDRSVVKSELNVLYTTCMYLQQSALTSGKEQVLQFDIEKNSYSFEKRIKTLCGPVIFGLKVTAFGPPSSPKNKINSPITFKSNRIVFYPDGIISSGTVYLTNRKKDCLYALSNGISQVSYLRKYSYLDKWKLIG